MLKHWWKILGVMIILYSFIAGMLIPLKPGIIQVDPSSLKTGETVVLNVRGYNTHFKDSGGQSMRAWLKADSVNAIASEAIVVKDNEHINVQFSVPAYLPIAARVHDFALILDNPVDGATVLPSAVFITQDSIDPSMATSIWSSNPIADLNVREGMTFPFRNILSETIRNTYFHVPLWFGMMIIFLVAVVYSWKYLKTQDISYDIKAQAFTSVGVLYGLLGLVTGAIWAKHTWGAYWSWDIKQNMTAISILIYLAYFVLRNSFEDQEKRGRISGVYNIFAFAALIPLIYVIPRMTDSLHPGNGGNPAFGQEDLDNTMRMIFYPSIIGWTLFGVWMANISYRIGILRERLWNKM